MTKIKLDLNKIWTRRKFESKINSSYLTDQILSDLTLGDKVQLSKHESEPSHPTTSKFEPKIMDKI